MPRTVLCRKYQTEKEGLERPPYPGAKGEAIFREVSKDAWQEWQAQQTMLINEKGLNMLDPAARQYLEGEMEKFLSGEQHDTAAGYIPPESSP